VCATPAQTVRPVLLRSYTTWAPSEENYDCFIWEAARATLAAPLFFEPTKISSTNATFVDGAVHLNNPITEVIEEGDYLYPGAVYRSIISIGTGWIDIGSLHISQLPFHDIIKTCIDMSQNANNAAQKFVREKQGKELAENGIYYRFDVDWGLDTVAFGQWQKLDDIDAFIESYLSRKGKELQDCARSLCSVQSTCTSPSNFPTQHNG
jgi:predicted acylesterase/phospholipase RssA